MDMRAKDMFSRLVKEYADRQGATERLKAGNQFEFFIYKMKAMFTPRKIEGNCFYFSTNTSSVRAQQFMKNPKASIYVYHRGHFKYEGIMLIGTMEVLQDDGIKQEIWRTGDTMYYKQGVTDPDYCVLKFTAIKGRHYCDLQTESFNIGNLE